MSRHGEIRAERAHQHVLITLAGLALVTVTLLAAGFGRAERTAGPERGVLYGDAIALGEGTARTYIEMKDGVPVELGVVLTEGVMRGLPSDHDHHGGITMPDGHRTYPHVLQLPEGNPTPFRHVGLDWNPAGHEPPGRWDAPHFDFHFYTIEEAERMRITPELDPQFDAKALNLPASEYVPPGYVAESMGVPFMGMHWVDPTTPELNGEPFTQTFIFGSWDGRMTFAEPMITKAFLESKPDFAKALPVPAKHLVPGYYPNLYRIRWDAQNREYRIALGLIHAN